MLRLPPTHPPSRWSAAERWSDMRDVEEDPPTLNSHQQLRWHVQCGGPNLSYPPSAISNWELKWHAWCGGPTLPIPHQPLAVQLNIHVQCRGPTPLAISSWELKWHVWYGGLTLHTPLAIGSWELNWCVMWRSHPIRHWQLRVELTCVVWRTHLPPSHWPSGVESWTDMCDVEPPPYPTPIIHQQLRVEVICNVKDPPYPTLPPIGHWQLRVEVTCSMWRTHPTLPSSFQCRHTETPGVRLVLLAILLVFTLFFEVLIFQSSG